MAEPAYPPPVSTGPTAKRKALFIGVSSVVLVSCAMSFVAVRRKRAASHQATKEEAQVQSAGEQAARKSRAAIRDTTQQGMGEDLSFDAAGNLQGAHVRSSDLPENKSFAQLERRRQEAATPEPLPGDTIGGRGGADESALPRPGPEAGQDPETLRARNRARREELADLRESFLSLPLDPRAAGKAAEPAPPGNPPAGTFTDVAVPTQPLAQVGLGPAPGAMAAPPFPATQQAQLSRPGEMADMRIGGGPEYVIPEGKFMDVTLQNQVRISGNDNPVVAQVTRDVLSEDGKWVLIPAGSILTGVAGRVQTVDQERVFIPGHRIRFPNRRVAYFPERILPPATSLIGEMGVQAKVNRHWMLRFGSAIILGMVEGLAAHEAGPVTTNPFGGSNLTSKQAGVQAAAENFNAVAQKLLDLYSNIPSTLTLPVGKRMKFYFSQDVRVNGYMRASDLHYIHRPRG